MADALSEVGISTAFSACVALGLKGGVRDLPNTGDGTYSREFGKWKILLNASDQEVEIREGSPKLPPLNVYVEFNGWPAGIINPYGGVIAAGECANEDLFIEAAEDALGCTVEAALETFGGDQT